MKFHELITYLERSFPEIRDKSWRMSKRSGFYWIKDKEGKRILFEPNWAQKELLQDSHPLKIIVKSRQLGVTTLYAISYLDDCIFSTDPIDTLFIADRRQSAERIFEMKVKFAWENLIDPIRTLFVAKNDSTNVLRWPNGSSYVVDTSARGSTCQRMHISEFGEICAKYPHKAQEIVEGALETVAVGQQITIESTSKGRGGYFYDMCQQAKKMQDEGEKLGPMDYKLFFFPWWKEPDYQIKKNQ